MTLDKDQLIKVYTSRLVNSLVPVEFGHEYIQSITNDLLNHLLKSPQTSSPYIDINQLTNHFKTLFLSNGLQELWIKFQSVLKMLSQTKSVDQICNYLIFLNGLQSTEESSLVPNIRITSIGNNSRGYHNIEEQRTHHDLQSSPYHVSSHSSKVGSKNITNIVPLSGVISPYYETLSEDTILTYLSYSLLGLDSKLLSFLRDGNSIELPPNINSSYSGLLHSILEPGLVYKKLKVFVDSNKGKIASPIKTAFLRSLESELNYSVNHINEYFNTEPTSLIAVYNALFPFILKLRLLYSLTNELNLSGYEFLSNVYHLSKFGDIRIKDLTHNIFSQIAAPYYEVLEHWIIKGELIDNSEEFFIAFNTEAQHINDIIEYLPQRIPDFFVSMNETMAYKIYQIGKMLIFLLKYCKELKWISDYSMKYSTYIFQNNQGIQSMPSNVIIDLINLQYEEILNYFTIVLQEKHSMFHHLQNFKRFLLMNSNDFIESIIEKGIVLFNEPANSLTSNQLSKVLIESINNSSVKNYRSDYKNRLDARILDLSHGNIGWEVFTLEYKISDSPIYHILNYNNGTLEYLKMFNFLWKLRHFSYLLNLNFIECSNVKKNDLRRILSRYIKLKRQLKSKSGLRLGIRDNKIIWLMKSFNTICLIRHQLIKFISTLVKYLSFDIIENNFDQLMIRQLFKSSSPVTHSTSSKNIGILPILNENFTKALKKDESNFSGPLKSKLITHNMNELTFDELINIHSTYLQKVTHFKILNDTEIGKHSGTSYIKQIYQFLEICFAFIKSSEEYNSLIVNYISILNVEENLRSEDMNQFDDDLEELENKIKLIVNKIYKDLYMSNYKSMLYIFIKDLRSDTELKDLSRFF